MSKNLKLIDKGINLFLKVRRELRASRNEIRAEKREKRAAENHENRTMLYFGRKLPKD